MDGDCADGAYAVNRLKAGPENIPDVLEQMAADGTKYSDPWTGKDVLYEPGYPAASTETTWGSNYDNGAWTYERWTDVAGYEDAVLFTDGTASYTDPRQGGAGTCYWISSLSGAAEWPELITDMFLTGTDMTGPDAGIIGVQFYIRGKPWVVTIDDKLIFETHDGNKKLKFNQPDANYSNMWAPILEKAWAKVKGNYEASEGGFVVSGLRAITGAPVFTYDTASIGTDVSEEAVFNLFVAANDAEYPMGAGTTGGSDTGRNDCGIATGHAYSILEPFEMTDANSVTTKMLLMRNPWGTTDYSAAWHAGDAAWTDELVAQVPWGVDPRTSVDDGLFTMPMSEFSKTTDGYNCIYNYEIAHHRASEGYSGDWYDAIDMDEQYDDYYITVPQDDGGLYFTVETYYQNIIPNECTTDTIDFGGGNTGTLSNPLLDYEVWKDGADIYTAYQYVSDQFSYPILITSYNAGDVFKVRAKYLWLGSPAKDYTVKIYSKQSLEVKNFLGQTNILHMDGQLPTGFTDSSFRGMNPPPVVDPVEEEEEVTEVAALGDLFAIAFEGGSFNLFAFLGACFQYPAVCFNPINWF